MKIYPSIPYFKEFLGRECIAQDKIDGSNIRIQWSKKRGWYKYGTRNRLFDASDPVFGCAIQIFENKLAEYIEHVLRTNKRYRGTEEAIAFAEFFGPSSFAGEHSLKEPKQLVLFDVNIHKKGFISPRDFVKDFEFPYRVNTVYEGTLTEEFVQDVIDGKYPLAEGIVAKGGSGHNLWMCKIKTSDWVDRVKAKFPQKWQEIV